MRLAGNGLVSEKALEEREIRYACLAQGVLLGPAPPAHYAPLECRNMSLGQCGSA